jgi:hypothetical protein
MNGQEMIPLVHFHILVASGEGMLPCLRRYAKFRVNLIFTYSLVALIIIKLQYKINF